MTDPGDDKQLQSRVSAALATRETAHPAPDFEREWARANGAPTHAMSRRPIGAAAGLGLLALGATLMLWRSHDAQPPDGSALMAEFSTRTHWVAPTDALLTPYGAGYFRDLPEFHIPTIEVPEK